jgi:O-succinylbenzoic acid--CoA ligase
MTTLETESLTWNAQQFEDQIESRIQVLTHEGLVSGDTFMFPATCHAETVWTLHAIIRMGAIAMPVAPNLNDDQRALLAQASQSPGHADTWLRLATSGTTGQPKTVDLTKTQIEASAMGSRKRLGHSDTDRWLCCLPLHHIGGLSILLRTALYGTTAVLHSRFDAQAVSDAIDHKDIHLVSLVPTMLQHVLDARNGRKFPSSLRAILLGGAPCPPILLDRCREIDAPVALTWGMTETASQVATRTPGDLRPELDAGRPLDGVTLHTQGDLLVVRGAIAPHGELITEDRGMIDPQGRVVVWGRGDALIISGGENVDPVRVERTLMEHPSVTEAVVVGRPDPTWGERPVAFVVASADAGLATWVAERLEPHEQPAEIHHLSAIPRTTLGKINRRLLRAQIQSSDGIGEFSRS